MADSTMKVDIVSVKPKHLEMPKSSITIKVSSKEVDVSTMERITEPVRTYLNDYRKVIDMQIKDYDGKLDGMTDKKEADKLIKQVNDELKKLVGNLEKEAQARTKAGWEKLKKENKAYAKWKIKIGANIVWGTVKIGKGIAALIASAGAKLDEYYKVAKSVYDIAKELQKALATEQKVRGDLMKAVEKLSKEKQNGSAGKSTIKKVEDVASEYEKKLTATRKKAESMAGPLQKLLQLQDQGAEITKKQEKQVNDMIVQIIDFNETYDAGLLMAKTAKQMAADTKGKIDFKTVKGYAEKVKKGVEVTLKVLKVAGEIL